MHRNRRATTFSLPPKMDEEAMRITEEEDRTLGFSVRQPKKVIRDRAHVERGRPNHS